MIQNSKKNASRYWLPLLVTSVYIFLYVPIIVLILFSFNESESAYAWTGMSLRWYKALFSSIEIWHAMMTSLLVACTSAFLSVTMGTLLVYGAQQYIKRVIALFYGSVLFPEIVIAVGLLSFFSLFSIPLGFITLVAGHTLLGLGFVIPIMHTRFEQLDKSVIQAGLDLGASHIQIFFYIIIPFLFPALAAASLLAFIISLDDFLISFFCAGATTQTLSLYIFAMIRTGVSPMVNALSTLIVTISSILVLIFSSSRIRLLDRLL